MFKSHDKSQTRLSGNVKNLNENRMQSFKKYFFLQTSVLDSVPETTREMTEPFKDGPFIPDHDTITCHQ